MATVVARAVVAHTPGMRQVFAGSAGRLRLLSVALASSPLDPATRAGCISVTLPIAGSMGMGAAGGTGWMCELRAAMPQMGTGHRTQGHSCCCGKHLVLMLAAL